jgi:serine/threonine protein kinase
MLFFNKEEYRVGKEIGKGAFGKVYSYDHKTDPSKAICCKKICYSNMSDYDRNQIDNEIVIMAQLNHSNIVKFFGYEDKKNEKTMYLYMELCADGDLGSLIARRSKEGKLLDEEFIWKVCAQLLGALSHCHSLRINSKDASSPQMILHRDLKAANGKMYASMNYCTH